jgi:hypothetical protein
MAQRDAALAKNEMDRNAAAEKFAAQFLTSAQADPTGLAIKDPQKRAAYVAGLAQLHKHYDLLQSLAIMDHESRVGGGRFGAEVDKAAGRGIGREIAGGPTL